MSGSDARFQHVLLIFTNNCCLSDGYACGSWLLFGLVHHDASLAIRRKGMQGEPGKLCCRASKFVEKTRREAGESSDVGVQ